MLEEAGESILSRLAEDAPEIWREADGVIVLIPALPAPSTTNLGLKKSPTCTWYCLKASVVPPSNLNPNLPKKSAVTAVFV
jgi:hypothetical protein